MCLVLCLNPKHHFYSVGAWSPLIGGAWFYRNQASQSERGCRSRALQLFRGLLSFAFKEDTRISDELQA